MPLFSRHHVIHGFLFAFSIFNSEFWLKLEGFPRSRLLFMPLLNWLLLLTAISYIFIAEYGGTMLFGR